ncbi:unnamed protein product [Aphanomyces euteiches]
MGSRKHYPLPSSFFSCPKLSPSEEAQFVSLAKESLQQFIEMGLEPMEYSWTSQGEQNGVRLYEGPPDPRHKHVVPYRGVTTIHGTIHEVAMLRAFETRELCLRHVHRNAKASNLLDIMPLYSFVERTSESPLQQIYVNWCAITSPLPIVKDRDFLFLESQDEFTLEDGRNGWAYCQHSIALASCPPQTLSGLSLVRGSIYHSGCIFIESADTPGVLEWNANRSDDPSIAVSALAPLGSGRQRTASGVAKSSAKNAVSVGVSVLAHQFRSASTAPTKSVITANGKWLRRV